MRCRCVLFGFVMVLVLLPPAYCHRLPTFYRMQVLQSFCLLSANFPLTLFYVKEMKVSFAVPLLNLLRCVKFFRCLSSVSKKNPCRFLVAISSLHSHFDYKKSVAVPLRFLLCFYCVFIKYRRPVVAHFLFVRSLFIPKI